MTRLRLDWLQERGNRALISGGLRGVEKESLRVTEAGRLARTPHPQALGSALTHPYITTDYSEALIEVVTPPQSSNRATLAMLADLHAFIHRRLDGEWLWPSSMPCVVNANEEIPIARYGRSNTGQLKTVYRRGLGHRYGRAMQAIAGVHFNYSPPEGLWPLLHAQAGSTAPLERFRSERLMGLARNYRRLSWLVIYLFGASPALCKSFRPDGHPLLSEFDHGTWYSPHATSLRMSDLGYRNTTQARLNISLNSTDEYVAGLAAAVSTADPRYAEIGVRVDGEYRQLNANILQIENEYYTSIRPKSGKGHAERPTIALRAHGVEYVEIRTLDLAPTEPLGVSLAQLDFLEALLLYCLLADSPPLDDGERAEIDARDLAAAREGRRPGLRLPHAGGTVALRSLALEILDAVGDVAAVLDTDEGRFCAAVDEQRHCVEHPDRTPSARLLDALRASGEPFFDHVRGLARAQHESMRERAFDPVRDRELEAIARRSLDEQRAVEAADAEPFDAFLARYVAEV